VIGTRVARTKITSRHRTTFKARKHVRPNQPASSLEALPLGRVPREGGDPDSAQRADMQPERAPPTDWTPAFAGDTACDTRARSLPAHPDESLDPGQNAQLVPPCSFIPAHAAQPFLDSDLRRNEPFM
jgi:hypothetical protein